MDGDLVKSGDSVEIDRRIALLNAGTDPVRNELNIASLRLELFPGDAFGAASFLRTLNLRNNMLEYLPETIGLFTNLEILNVSNNKLKAVPNAIGDLERLCKLQLDHNRIKELPEQIGELASLEELQLGSNRLELLPESLNALVRLEVIDARDNKIEHFNDGFDTKNLPNLRIVNFTGNPIKAYPWSIKCLQESFPILTNNEERRRLVKRNLEVRKEVNRKLVL